MSYGLDAQFLEERALSFRGIDQPREIKNHLIEWDNTWESKDPLTFDRAKFMRNYLYLQSLWPRVERERGKE